MNSPSVLRSWLFSSSSNSTSMRPRPSSSTAAVVAVAVEAPWAVVEFDIEAKVAAVADIEEPTVAAAAAVVASLAFVQQRDPFASFAAAAE
eukprot:scaffold22984_cov72-Skeletonema_dohrnii-CCMP3373.AAC.1